MTETVSWRKPLSDWLPLARAPFYFHPHYCRPGAELKSAMQQSLDRSVDNRAAVTVLSDDRFGITCLNVRLELDISAGTFSIWNAVSAEFEASVVDDMDGNPIGTPDVFFDFAGSSTPLPEFAAAYNSVISIARVFWISCLDRFDRAVHDETAQIVGQWNNLAADFSPVFPHVWDHLRHCFQFEAQNAWDDPAGPVLKHKTATIYNPMVRPIPVSPTARAEAQMAEWLIDLMRRDDVAPKDEIRDRAKVKWGRLFGQRAFDRAWQRAANTVRNKHFGRGRKRNKINHPTS